MIGTSTPRSSNASTTPSAVAPGGSSIATAAMLAAARAGLDEGAARLDAVGDDRDRVTAAHAAGDADTNAAIAGALLGARDGLAALPRRWVERVHDAVPADEALATRYHPRALVELLP